MAHLKKVPNGHLSKIPSEPPPPPTCTGVDPLCSDCNCDTTGQIEFLANTYTVTIAGFPAICGVDIFNGAWTVTNFVNCGWRFAVSAFHTVTLQFVSASTWRVTWAVTAPGGANGYYSAATPPPIADCKPTEYAYVHDFCFGPFLCFGLCAGVSGGTITVSA